MQILPAQNIHSISKIETCQAASSLFSLVDMGRRRETVFTELQQNEGFLFGGAFSRFLLHSGNFLLSSSLRKFHS